MRKSIGYGAYGFVPDFSACKFENGSYNCPPGLGDGIFAPDFTVCKSEGGTADCPSEYVKEFSGLMDLASNKVVLLGIAAAVGGLCWWKFR
jgi:hypothetical protein